MNFSLKPNPLMAVWLPGFVTLLAVLYFKKAESPLTSIIPNMDSTLGTLGLIAFGFVIGNLLDAIRDILEWPVDKFSEINWDFFISGSKDHLQNLEEWFYTWYELDCNLWLGTILFVIFRWKSVRDSGASLIAVLAVFLIVLSLSAFLTRRTIKTQIDRLYDDKKIDSPP
jgi:hypothetical protein